MNNIANIVLNLSAGLSPKHLSQSEIEELVKEYGENWLEVLGYA